MRMLIFTILLVSLNAIAFEGHNGITFNSKKFELEKRGFLCKESNHRFIKCNHLELTGKTLGYETTNYSVNLYRKNGSVASIVVYISGNPSIEDFNSIVNRARAIFGGEDKTRTSVTEATSTFFFRDTDKTAIQILWLGGVSGVLKDNIAVTFFSAEFMKEWDKVWYKDL